MSIVRIFGGVALGLLALAVGLWFVLPDACGNEVVAEYPSPNNQYKLVVFQRDCGATTGFSTQASVLKADKTLDNSAGNVFASDTNHGAAPSGPGGGPGLRIRWETNEAITISFHPAVRVFKSRPAFEGVLLDFILEDNAVQLNAQPEVRVKSRTPVS